MDSNGCLQQQRYGIWITLFHTIPIWKTSVFCFHPGIGRRGSWRILSNLIKYLESKTHSKRTSACRRKDVQRNIHGPSGAVNVGRGSVRAAICKHKCRPGPTYVTNGPWGSEGEGLGWRTGWKGMMVMVLHDGPVHPWLEVIHQTRLGSQERATGEMRQETKACLPDVGCYSWNDLTGV